jgi:short-subunit dehydrogenase
MRGMRGENLRVLLTGASGGIGRPLALALAAEGAELLLTGRDPDRLEALCADVRAAGGRARCVAADLNSAEGRRLVIDAAGCSDVNILINNAAVGAFGQFAHQSEEEITQLVGTNLLAGMLLTRSLLPLLLQHRRAGIVNVGSIIGSLALPGQVAYSATKFGLRGFTEGLRRELTDTPVQVLYVAPRATDTAMNGNRLRRFNERFGVAMDSPGLVAAKIVRAMARGSGEHFLGWPEKLFVRLNALLPSLVDGGLRKQSLFLNHDPDEAGEGLVHQQEHGNAM